MTRSFLTVSALAGLLMPMAAFASPATQPHVVLASAMPSSNGQESTTDMPLIIAKLQNQVQEQQAEINHLQSDIGQSQNANPEVTYSTTIPTNLGVGG